MLFFSKKKKINLIFITLAFNLHFYKEDFGGVPS